MSAAAFIFNSLVSPSRHSIRLAYTRPLSNSPPSTFHRPSMFVMRIPKFQNIVASSMNTKYTDCKSQASLFEPEKFSPMHFVKYHGLGNDFILVDNRQSSEPKITSKQAVKLCNRNFGIGADGVILVLPGVNGTDYAMRIFNSDGSIAEMCGNGIRCFAKFVAEFDKPHGKKRFTVHTAAGVIIPEIHDDGRVKVDMGNPILKASLVPTKLPPNDDQSVIKSLIDVDETQWNVTCLSMGNPHCVTFGSKGSPDLVIDELNLSEIGPKFEHHPMFPARTNTEFVQVISRSHLKMRVWERGAGETLACGTGACAVLIAAVLEGRADRSCSVDLRGGTLEIEWREDNNRVYMTGPAEVVFYGSIPL